MKDLISHESIDENLRFLIIEVGKQIERTREYLHNGTVRLPEVIDSRDDYIDNLKSVIQGKVLTLASSIREENPAQVQLLKTVDVVTINLERIADFCGNVVSQFDHVNENVRGKLDFGPFFEQAETGMGLIEHALFEHDIQAAIQICRVEGILDELYLKVFGELCEELKQSKEAQSLVTAIFIAHYFERMGDSLLNIGEAILSACLGEPIKIGQFHALEDSLKAAEIRESVDDVSLQAITGTRSGHRIARVFGEQESGTLVIFKEGRARKLREERDSIERWEAVAEGLAPKIYSFQERGDTGAILFEYLPGTTLEQILLRGAHSELDTVLTRLSETLTTVWEKTLTDEPVRPRFAAQLAKRLEDLYVVHPSYRESAAKIGDIEVLSFGDLVERASVLDDALPAPFSVFIHGDFNVDNIIYDPSSERLRFIDLHRSRQVDYVQDVSVFLVSNFRLQVFKASVRERINHSIHKFFEFSQEFASRHEDSTFAARVALGLARSFATSTRFVLDPGFSTTMMHRARYLLERLLDYEPASLAEFKLPREVLID